MAPGVLLICALTIGLLYPLAAPWRKPSLYIGLLLWFASWLAFFYLSQIDSIRYDGLQNPALVGLFIFSLATGSLIRVASRGIAAWARRHRGQPPNPPAGGP